jgi:hypothetical protein
MTCSVGLYARKQNMDKFSFWVFNIRPHLCAEALRLPARSRFGEGRVRRHKGLHYNYF